MDRRSIYKLTFSTSGSKPFGIIKRRQIRRKRQLLSLPCVVLHAIQNLITAIPAARHHDRKPWFSARTVTKVPKSVIPQTDKERSAEPITTTSDPDLNHGEKDMTFTVRKGMTVNCFCSALNGRDWRDKLISVGAVEAMKAQ